MERYPRQKSTTEIPQFADFNVLICIFYSAKCNLQHSKFWIPFSKMHIAVFYSAKCTFQCIICYILYRILQHTTFIIPNFKFHSSACILQYSIMQNAVLYFQYAFCKLQPHNLHVANCKLQFEQQRIWADEYLSRCRIWDMQNTSRCILYPHPPTHPQYAPTQEYIYCWYC